MKRKPFAHSAQAGGNAKRKLADAMAYRRLFDGNGTKEDAEMVLSDLAYVTDYFKRPKYGEWLKNVGTPHGFELHSALSNARGEVVQHIMDQIHLTDEELIALEKAARLEA